MQPNTSMPTNKQFTCVVPVSSTGWWDPMNDPHPIQTSHHAISKVLYIKTENRGAHKNLGTQAAASTALCIIPH